MRFGKTIGAAIGGAAFGPLGVPVGAGVVGGATGAWRGAKAAKRGIHATSARTSAAVAASSLSGSKMARFAGRHPFVAGGAVAGMAIGAPRNPDRRFRNGPLGHMGGTHLNVNSGVIGQARGVGRYS